MKEETKRKTRGFVAAIVVLAVVAGVLTFGYIGNTVAMTSYANQLENNYQRSVYELLNDVNNIESNLSKAVVSTGTTARQKIFNTIYTQCTQASEDLSRLPISHESIDQTTTFINQAGGFSYYIENKLKNSEALSDDDSKSISELHSMSVYIKQILNDFVSKNNGKYNILADSKNQTDNNNNVFNDMFSTMQAEGVEYPTLIYDGPFSESQTKKEIKGIVGEEITKENAQNEIEKLYDGKNIKNLEYLGETDGIFKTYNFILTNEQNREIYIQITKKGGFVLTISSYAGSDKDELELSACEQKAEEFAQSLGLDVKAVWSTKVTGMAYINLTPIVDGVIIYPDMIKVKVSCSTGEVLGWEAQSYAYNHIERANLTATISESTARSKISSLLTIETQKLTLIPVQYGNETLCYEYKCTLDNSTYYVYIDAKTGDEVQILKVVATTSGKLLI